MERERVVVAGCPNASNPFHECAEYCNRQRSQNPSKLKADHGGGKNPVRSGEGLRNVDPDCVNASNPFHQCGDYCTKKTSETEKSGRFAFPVLLKLSPRSSSGRSDEGRAVTNGKILGVEGRKVDPTCINASNPFHQCGDYCTKKTTDVKQIRTGKAAQNGGLSMEIWKTGGGSKVDPTCANASNPFHQCTEHCSQGSSGTKRGTLGSLLARESDEEMSTRENKKEEVVIRERGKVDPRCPNASNPFHECAEYCLPKTSGSAQSEEGKQEIMSEPSQVLLQEC